jgi:hypothetical protein
MLGITRRRLLSLERSIQAPLTAELFLSRVHELARRTGTTFDAACEGLGRQVERPRLAAVSPVDGGSCLRRGYGGSAAAKQEVLMGLRDSENALTDL